MPEGGAQVVAHGAVTGRLIRATDLAGDPATVAGRAAPRAGGAVPPVSPWSAGIATGVGSLPGTAPGEAAALVAGELPDLPHLVELPRRGAGADMIGRAVAVLVGMPAEVVPSGWRLARRPGRDQQRALDFLAWDLDAAEQHFAGAGWVKVQIAGPWTLAAQLETPNGHRALLDPGAVGDIAASLREGLVEHVAELGRRLPGTGIVVQVDEPSLPAALAGALPTASGFGTVAAVDPARAGQVLADLVAGLDGRPVVAHCCHPDIPVAFLRQAGFHGLSTDLTSVGTAAGRIDPIAEAVEAGAVLLAGLVPARAPGPPGGGAAPSGGGAADADVDIAEVGADGGRGVGGRGVVGRGVGGTANGDEAPRVTGGTGPLGFRDAAEPLLALWHTLGLPDSRLAQVVVTPVCGLAEASPAWARRALVLARDAARLLGERSGLG